MRGCIRVCTSRAAASPATAGAIRSQSRLPNTVTAAMTNGELTMKSCVQRVGDDAVLVHQEATTNRTAK